MPMRMPDEILNELLSREDDREKRFLIKELTNSLGSITTAVRKKIEEDAALYARVIDDDGEEVIRMSDLKKILHESDTVSLR